MARKWKTERSQPVSELTALESLDLAGRPGVAEFLDANALVNGDRQAAYGRPIDSYTAQAKIWSGMLADKLNADLTAEDVVLLLTAMKLRRQAHRPKRDNIVDTHGYLLVLAHVEAARGK